MKKLNVTIIISICDWVENIAGKGENAGYTSFVYFWQFLLIQQWLFSDLHVTSIFDTKEKLLEERISVSY